MPYSYPGNIPRPARKWTPGEQKKCVSAANAVLSGGGSEQDAIFACIRAAGKTKHPGGEGSVMEMSDLWVDVFNATKVLNGEPVCLIPLMESGYHRGGLKRPPITKETLAAITQNFEQRETSGYYLEHVPLNVEHDDVGGAIGSIQSVELKDDGVYAIFDLTPKGKTKLEEGEFSYLSPEIRWATEDVKSGEDIGPSLAGAAATNYPFWGNRTAMYSDRAFDQLFEEYPADMSFAGRIALVMDQFRNMVAGVAERLEGGDPSNRDPGSGSEDPDNSQESQQEVTMPGNGKKQEMEIPQEILDRMTALEAQAEEHGQQMEQREEMIQTQRQEIETLNLARVRDRFAARAEEFSAIGADNGDLTSELTWLYLVDQTEERTHFAFFDSLLETLDTALGESEAFRQSGRTGDLQSSAEGFARIDGLVQKLAKERSIDAQVGSPDYNTLAMEVMRANPELYDQHRQDTLGGAATVPA